MEDSSERFVIFLLYTLTILRAVQHLSLSQPQGFLFRLMFALAWAGDIPRLEEHDGNRTAGAGDVLIPCWPIESSSPVSDYRTMQALQAIVLERVDHPCDIQQPEAMGEW